jgi:hypothetical protein
MNIFKAITGILPAIAGIVGKAVPDKDLAKRLMHDIEVLVIGVQAQLVQAKASIIIAEAQGASWIQRNWRPITMLTFVFIIANNYILVPYAVALTGPDVIPMLDIPPGMWSLLTVGIGGYIGGRSYEKGLEIKARNRDS